VILKLEDIEPLIKKFIKTTTDLYKFIYLKKVIFLICYLLFFLIITDKINKTDDIKKNNILYQFLLSKIVFSVYLLHLFSFEKFIKIIVNEAYRTWGILNVNDLMIHTVYDDFIINTPYLINEAIDLDESIKKIEYVGPNVKGSIGSCIRKIFNDQKLNIFQLTYIKKFFEDNNLKELLLSDKNMTYTEKILFENFLNDFSFDTIDDTIIDTFNKRFFIIDK
jgi:hypothetical protein